jgi:glucose/arabinose dehydrogenase
MLARCAIAVLLCSGVCAFAQQQQSQAPAKSQPQKQSPSQANPFPEEKSQKAADAANTSAAPSGASSSHVDLNRLDAPAGSAARISNGAGRYIHDPQLAAKDQKVGNFYLSTHDYKGAYDRFLEATRVAPEDGNAVFGLAEAARGLHRNKEAITNYSVYLQAFPDGKKAKDAEKALAELGAAPKKK